MITVASPEIGAEEISAVNEVLKSGIIAQGPKVAELEKSFATYCGTKHAFAVSSGTAAIHAALYAAGIQPGDEVITTPFSFIATINPILFVSAKPVLVDISEVDFNIDAQAIKDGVTSKTKAIMPVHLYGQPADSGEIKKIASSRKIKIIEDACQAIGASFKDKKTGNLGDLGCFSLYATKNIMSGEGGMITTNNDEMAALIKRFRQHGMTAPYEYADFGYNYRMTDLQAAIAVEQLKKVDTFTQKRQRNAKFYDEELKGIKGVILPKLSPNRTHAYHQYTIRITEDFPLDRSELFEILKTKGIICGIYYPKPLHSYKHIQKLGYKIGDFPVAEKVASQVISLPVHPKLSKEDLNKVVAAIREVASGK